MMSFLYGLHSMVYAYMAVVVAQRNLLLVVVDVQCILKWLFSFSLLMYIICVDCSSVALRVVHVDKFSPF